MHKKLFVYGSLSDGMIHHGLIADFIEESKPAFVMGAVYRLEVGYPVLSEQGNHRVAGQLVSLSNGESLIAILDQFHGFSPIQPEKSLHHRVSQSVFETSGEKSEAYVYVINPKKLSKSAKLIQDGNWQDNFKGQPPLTEQLEEKEKTYILKLSQCTGRDIVPIQMDIYRSLMNQGIIVDKGRRLALTKLGQEICRFLK